MDRRKEGPLRGLDEKEGTNSMWEEKAKRKKKRVKKVVVVKNGK